MDVIRVVHDYIEKMTEIVKGMKVFLLDKETTGIVSLCFSQTQIVQKDVYLLERLDSNRKSMLHLKAVCFVRPTLENVNLLAEELKEPKYGEYHIVFSNIVPESYLRTLAEADEHEAVRDVKEFYADFFAVNSDLFSLNLRSLSPAVPRLVEGLSSVLLSLKKRPDIRFQANSDLSSHLASSLAELMGREKALFEFRRGSVPPLLLIYDRRNDPVTPLLHQWTYQAMVHELIGMDNNRSSLKNVPGVPKELEEVTLSPAQDEFYRTVMYHNFGDLGLAIQNLVKEYQVKMKTNQSLQSIEEMRKFVQNYPEFRKLSGNVSKHVTMVGELSRQSNTRNLLDVSKLQQTLACTHDHSGSLKNLKELIENPKITAADKLRLVLLFALRYEKSSNELYSLQDLLSKSGVDSSDIKLINQIQKYGGVNSRIGDLFQNKDLLAIASQVFKNGLGLTGATNVFTQHKPLLKDILDRVFTGKLPDTDYPFLSNRVEGIPEEVIVFIIGGATFSEAVVVHEFNAAGRKVTLGGSSILNSSMFLAELTKLYQPN